MRGTIGDCKIASARVIAVKLLTKITEVALSAFEWRQARCPSRGITCASVQWNALIEDVFVTNPNGMQAFGGLTDHNCVRHAIGDVLDGYVLVGSKH